MRTPRGVICEDCWKDVRWGIEIPPQQPPYSEAPVIRGYCGCSTRNSGRVWVKAFGQRLTWVEYLPGHPMYGHPHRYVDVVMFKKVMGRSMTDEEIGWKVTNMTTSDIEVSWF